MCCLLYGRMKGRGVREGLETFTHTHTLTDEQEGRHGTTCSSEQEALASVSTPTKVSRGCPISLRLPSYASVRHPFPQHFPLIFFPPPFVSGNFTLTHVISITPKNHELPPTTADSFCKDKSIFVPRFYCFCLLATPPPTKHRMLCVQ